MCSHYQAEKRRRQIEKHFGIRLPPEWEPPPGGLQLRGVDFVALRRGRVARRPRRYTAGLELGKRGLQLHDALGLRRRVQKLRRLEQLLPP